MNAGEYRLALEMYGSLNGDESVPAKLRAEADRILPTLRTRALRQLRELIIAERFEEALVLAGSITRRTGEVERVQRELARMYKRLRSIAVEIEKSEGDSDELERVLRLISQIRPDDQSMLRRLALELMRQFRFAEAAEVWSRVHLLAPDNESAARALDRCETLARRRSGVEIRATA
jgi:DNA polymerase III gamma/tau subunit